MSVSMRFEEITTSAAKRSNSDSDKLDGNGCSWDGEYVDGENVEEDDEAGDLEDESDIAG